MFKRKLAALDYHKDFDPQDENQFRQMVVWLEDMKIRLYPIDGRQNLRDVANSQWEQTLRKVTNRFEMRKNRHRFSSRQFLEDLKYPYGNETIADRLALTDWLIGTAIRFEFGDNGEKISTFTKIDSTSLELKIFCLSPFSFVHLTFDKKFHFDGFLLVEKFQSVASTSTKPTENENPLEKIDFSSEEFRSGISKIAELLKIPTKSNDTAAILRVRSKFSSLEENFDDEFFFLGREQNHHDKIIERRVGKSSNERKFFWR